MNSLLLCLVFAFLGFTFASLPNIVLIVTDDQDVVLNGMTPMKNVQELAKEGATFINAFTSSPICCPSRASILTGKYAHNHATVNNSVDGGCYGQFWRDVNEKSTLPVLLQSHGYETFFAGKYLNDYRGVEVPTGWNNWYGLHGNSVYYNYTLTENGEKVSYGDEYLTDVLAEKSLKFLKENTMEKPFFMMVTPPAPHAPATPAPRHQTTFPDVKARRTPNFNQVAEILDKHWVVRHPPVPIPDELLPELDEITRRRWQSLLAVDEMVRGIISELEESGIIENTFIVFTSDNGYHIGQFAQPYDKRQPYETDIRIPLVVRGPGVMRKSIIQQPTLLIDLMPTILEWAQLKSPENLDGTSFREDVTGVSSDSKFRRQFLVEYWGEGNSGTHSPSCVESNAESLYMCTEDAACHCQDAKNNTYACVRDMSSTKDFLYCEFKDTEHFAEAYDLLSDPYQISNIAFDMLPSVRAIYSLVLKNLTTCIGMECRKYYYKF
ncbi:N-acetylglucosamine-6-sulfatase [Sergentomyia squamirostris]